MDQAVKKYIEKQKSPQKEVIRKLRRIILNTFPKIDERMHVGVPWYQDWFYIVGLKDHVNLGFSVLGLTKKQAELFEGKGKMMRHRKFFRLKDISEKEIVPLLKMVKKYSKKCH